MATTMLRLAIVMLVLVAGFTSRIVYEEITNPSTLALAQDDPRTGTDCEDYSSQALAQEVLRSDPRDPNVLDEDNDGIACETFDYPEGTPRDETPVALTDDDNGGSNTATTTATSTATATAAPNTTTTATATATATATGTASPTSETGGPKTDTFPLLKDGSCPSVLVKHDGACHPR